MQRIWNPEWTGAQYAVSPKQHLVDDSEDGELVKLEDALKDEPEVTDDVGIEDNVKAGSPSGVHVGRDLEN